MFIKIKKILLTVFILAFYNCYIFCQSNKSIIPDNTNKNIDVSLKNEINHSIESGLKWLYKQHEKNGSWQNDPAITSLALSSFLRYNSTFTYNDSVIFDGFDYSKKCVKNDGGIYVKDLPNYTTSICLMAFKDASNNTEFNDIINNAEKFLTGLQYDEDKGFTKDSLS